MSGPMVEGQGDGANAEAPLPGWWRGLHRGEDFLSTVALGLMLLLPVLEIVLRSAFKTGVSGSSMIVQHLTLVVGMLGGALAARDGRLLALSPVQTLLRGRAQIFARLFSAIVASCIVLFLAVASIQYVWATKPLGKILAYGIPIWVIQLVLPIGFAVITLRLLWKCSSDWRQRLFALAAAAVAASFVVWGPASSERLMMPALITLAVATVLGAPVFVALGGTALILFWGHGSPIAPLPLKHYSLTTNDMLPSLPIFTLAGYFLAEGGASKRLVRVFQAWVGQFRGGPAIVTALACAFFTSFTGASGVTILALGGVLMPVLLGAKYSERAALGLLTGAGSLGMLLPPCLPLILYAVVANNTAQANISIKQMFLGGIGPGIVLIILTALWGIRQGPRTSESRPKFQWSEAKQSLWDAKWEMLIPVVALVSLFTVPTTVEAAALTALYSLIVATVIHRDLHPLRDLPRVMSECGMLVGGVLLILGVAMGFTHYLVDAQVPDTLVEWSTGAIKSKALFLFCLNLVLIIVGGLIEIYAAIVVVVPLLVPIGVAFGMDPIHLGILFLANMELGFIAPPVGLNLLLASYRFKKPMLEVMRAVLPMLFVLLLGVLLITYFPLLTTFLPSLVK